MCGIVGVCGEDVPAAKLQAAVEVLRHRGPDDSGVYYGDNVSLGHRRLSIIDLSEAAKQPMSRVPDGSTIVFNGEIYNYIELRKQLEGAGCRFRTNSDTEVLLAAFEQWGTEAFAKLNGMWAFAVWVPREQTLYFCRDRFAVKPFYYLYNGERFAFASEPKALLSLFPEYRRVDEVALYRFLAQGQLYGHDRSFYAGVRVLPGGHYGTFSAQTGRLVIKRYWSYGEEIGEHESPATAAEEFRAIFEDAVKVRLRSDVPSGLTLSGGLDSSSILSATHRLGHGGMRCFTSCYEDPSAGEMRWAKLAAAKQGNKLVSVEATGSEWLDTLPKIAWHMDAPGYSPAVYPLWCLMARARADGVPVMLEGQGADELLGGYVSHAIANFVELALHFVTQPGLTGFGGAKRAWDGLSLSFPRRMILTRLLAELFPQTVPFYRRLRGAQGVLRSDFVSSVAQRAEPMELPSRRGGDRVNSKLRYDHGYRTLPGLLHYGDAMSMAHGVESRHPFLDYRLVEWAFRQVPEVKFAQGQTKWPVRNYLRETGWQEFGDRWDKQGYPTPTDAWMRESDGLVLRSLLLSGESRLSEFCEPARLERLVRKYLGGASGAGNHLYRLISTEVWLRSCL